MQAVSQKMSELITDKENKRFAANTTDMTQDNYFVIAILEMCTDPELSKRFCEVKTNELTWEKLKNVAEVYERATASDNKAMMVNSKKKELEKEPYHARPQHKAVLEMQQERAQHKRMQDRQR